MGGRAVSPTTGKGQICPKCGWPAPECHCAASLQSGEQPVPPKITARLWLEKRGSGKSVTVIGGLPRNAPFLSDLAKQLKKSCGTGGSAGDSFIELQGDQRERLEEILAKKGFSVKK